MVILQPNREGVREGGRGGEKAGEGGENKQTTRTGERNTTTGISSAQLGSVIYAVQRETMARDGR